MNRIPESQQNQSTSRLPAPATAPHRRSDSRDVPTVPIPRELIDTLLANESADGDSDGSESTPEVPLSVWATAQAAPASQRKGRYMADSTAHPAKMLPAVAAHAVAHYTRPGDIVLDPMCGIGTTLVEAVHLGRHAIGVEYEPRWVAVTRANLDLARRAGADPDGIPGRVVQGDARQLRALLPTDLVGRVALVVTSPPYGPSVHGQVDVVPGGGIHKRDYRYGNTLDRGNLANIGHHRLLAGFTRILAGCAEFLRPGGHVAITVRPWREHAELIDLPSQILACGIHAGLVPVERCVALLARVADNDLVARGSFFQRDHIRKQREAGLPLHLIAHEDLLVLQRPPNDPNVRPRRGPASRPTGRRSRTLQRSPSLTQATRQGCRRV
jgi:SAM-dependent methyltransferase